MDEILAMNRCQSSQHTLNDIGALLKRQQSMFPSCLIGVDISSIAELHNDKYPTFVYIKEKLPSKVRESLTMFLWMRSLMLWISC